jgi:hypothetical protein
MAKLRFVLGNEKPDKDKETDTLWIGYLKGKTLDGGVDKDREILGAGISYMLGPVWFRGEFADGKHKGVNVRGWSALVALPLSSGTDTVFARYDIYDEDTDTGNNSLDRWTVGVAHDMDSKTRLTLAHDFQSPDSGRSSYSKYDGDVTTLRLQIKY